MEGKEEDKLMWIMASSHVQSFKMAEITIRSAIAILKHPAKYGEEEMNACPVGMDNPTTYPGITAYDDQAIQTLAMESRQD